MASSSHEEQSEVEMVFVQNMQSDLVWHVVVPFNWHEQKRNIKLRNKSNFLSSQEQKQVMKFPGNVFKNVLHT